MNQCGNKGSALRKISSCVNRESPIVALFRDLSRIEARWRSGYAEDCKSNHFGYREPLSAKYDVLTATQFCGVARAIAENHHKGKAA